MLAWKQAIRLAQAGFRVTASDLSAEEISRAKREAAARKRRYRVFWLRHAQAHRHHGSGYDLVISCNNSIAHLLRTALIRMHACGDEKCVDRPGGHSLSP